MTILPSRPLMTRESEGVTLDLLASRTEKWRQAMTDPKEQQNAEEEQIAEDLTLAEEEAEAVRGGDGISLSFSKIHIDYTPQKSDG